MSDHTYKLIELAGSSTVSSDDAIKNAIKKASATIQNMGWYEVLQTRGHIENGDVMHWQVVLKIGFRIED